MKKCITCGSELHPERARKYDYCMAPDCQAKNLKGLTMVAVGVNKSAEQYLLLDEETRTELAEGKYHDQRRGTFGVPTSAAPPSPGAPAHPAQPSTSPAGTGPTPAGPRGTQATPNAARTSATPGAAGTSASPATTGPAQVPPARPTPGRRPVAGPPPRQPGTPSQRRLAVLYNQQGLRPDEIARKLGLSRYEVTQIILAARGQGKL